jgi:phosphoribosyl 1,2-cyclic phosphodiesterase
MIVSVLGSGSKGNSTYIETTEAKVLVDFGLPVKPTQDVALSKGLDLSYGLDSVFVTHEHQDHWITAPTLPSLAGDVKVCMPEKTLENCKNKVKDGACTDSSLLHKFFDDTGVKPEFCPVILEAPSVLGRKYSLCDFFISYFKLWHDVPTVGYVVEDNNGKKVGIATDTGQLDANARDILASCDLIVLESNYDEEMLINGDYPEDVKKRILSKYGHLSNKYAAKYVSTLGGSKVKNVILAHISEKNNTPKKIGETFDAILSKDRNRLPRINFSDQQYGSAVFLV